jgi:hypothetical protein
MAYVDNNLLLSGSISATGAIAGQTVFSAGTSVLSTNTVDLGVARDIGQGFDLFGRFEYTVAAVGGTSIEMQVISATDAALTTSVTVLGTTGPIPVASLTLGSRFVCDINPVIGSKGQRYLGLRYISVGTTTAGSVFGDLGAEIQDGQKFYPNGFSLL